MPRAAGRGAGLGNELIPWAKAFIASEILGARLVHPAWGLNPRNYSALFGTSKLDWLHNRALATVLPRFTLTEEDFQASGGEDFAVAVKEFDAKHGLSARGSWLFEAEGMWGGYRSIRSAKPFVKSVLYGAKGTVGNLFELSQRVDPNALLVAVHVRLGDFAAADPQLDYRGKFNQSIPLEWFARTCRSIKGAFGDRVQFCLYSDGSAESLSFFIKEFNPILTMGQKFSDCSDLLGMASADLLICSMSSYSFWAAFLSDHPYLCFEPALQVHGELRSLWGHEDNQVHGLTSRNIARSLDGAPTGTAPRGVPVGWNGEVPLHLLDYLESVLLRKPLSANLVEYGVAPFQPSD